MVRRGGAWPAWGLEVRDSLTRTLPGSAGLCQKAEQAITLALTILATVAEGLERADVTVGARLTAAQAGIERAGQYLAQAHDYGQRARNSCAGAELLRQLDTTRPEGLSWPRNGRATHTDLLASVVDAVTLLHQVTVGLAECGRQVGQLGERIGSAEGVSRSALATTTLIEVQGVQRRLRGIMSLLADATYYATTASSSALSLTIIS